jgi:outer membrane protein OmpA-like peptidoglycan-associated protein
VKTLSSLAAAALAIVLVSGCASMSQSTSTEKSVPDTVANDMKTGRESYRQPWICAAAGALVAGGLASTENREAALIGALVGGGVGYWACSAQEKPLPDADGDGVPDRTDMCPDTPKGKPINANGCPVDQDTDGDGVPDVSDQCPATAAGTVVDANGCAIIADGDRDGVPDKDDLCPNTPAGAVVLPNGCEEDTDQDGVPDSRDRCQGTPRGVEVGPDGCARDTDGDGVPDALDNCPDTQAGTKVDQGGCPVAAPAKGAAAAVTAIPSDETRTVELKGVTFDSGSANIRRASLPALDRLAEALKARPDLRVEIAGHTDSSGSAQLNRALSQRRADAVMAYLVSRGVPAANLVAKGYGSDEPVADNATSAGRAKNRRVELRKLDN